MTYVSFYIVIIKYLLNMKNLETLINKYNKAIPRYTSFPPVPYWHDMPTEAQWMSGVFKDYQTSSGVDIYVHVPFCEKLCYYCGCSRVITKNHDNEDVFVEYLLKEWSLYSHFFSSRFKGQSIKINSIHFGGGTPNFLSAANLKKIIDSLCFSKSEDFFGSIEVDPRTVSFEQLEMLLSLGVTRFSFGIQDFDPKVQKAINREQSFEMIDGIVKYLRSRNVESINFDLIYGLPNQTLNTIEDTFSKVVELNPDMIAFYSYAHLPDKLKNQKLIRADQLPSPTLKRELYLTGKNLLEKNGFVEIGMDHFAKKDNFLVKCLNENKLRRSFMGYTDKRSNILLALGPTAISESLFGFAQNEKDLGAYIEKLKLNQLPLANGSVNTERDVLVAQAIQEIMCNFTIQKELVNDISSEMSVDLSDFLNDGLLVEDQTSFHVTDLGRAFVRNLANAFDFYDQDKTKNIKFSQSI